MTKKTQFVLASLVEDAFSRLSLKGRRDQYSYFVELMEDFAPEYVFLLDSVQR